MAVVLIARVATASLELPSKIANNTRRATDYVFRRGRLTTFKSSLSVLEERLETLSGLKDKPCRAVALPDRTAGSRRHEHIKADDPDD